ncbi:hypothetical protein D3C87_1590640 [compost metagenome]
MIKSIFFHGLVSETVETCLPQDKTSVVTTQNTTIDFNLKALYVIICIGFSVF